MTYFHEAGSERSTIRRLICSVILLITAATAQAAPEHQAFSLLAGGGILQDHLSNRTYAGVAYDPEWSTDWRLVAAWSTSVYPEISLSRWGGCSGSVCEHLIDLGVMPVLRFHTLPPENSHIYIDLGLGGNLISQTRIAKQVYSTSFQFSEVVGLGAIFGDNGRYDIGLRYLHESNANIKMPNDGMNFILLRLAIRW